MFLYRVDKRDFNPTEEIVPSTDYNNSLIGLTLEVENKLDEVKPKNTPCRNECLFLFYNLSSALLFSSKYGGNIYVVKVVKKEDCYHRADMNIADSILKFFKVTTDEQTRNDIARWYWEAGSHTFLPCYEVLVSKATVIEKILDNSQRPNANLGYQDIERTDIFFKLLQRVKELEATQS